MQRAWLRPDATARRADPSSSCTARGATGKSTLLDAAAYVLGDYAHYAAPSHSYNGRATRSRGHRGDARARLVTASEPESGRAFAESLLKT